MLEKPRHLPQLQRLSVIAATLLVAYALARFINYSVSSLAFQLPGLFLSFQIDLRVIVALIVAGLAASGSAWLVGDHPAARRRPRPEHWIIPMLTAWVIGIPLFQFPLGPLWWAIFFIGGGILMLVLLAEYIVVDDQDLSQPVASAGLTVVSFALFLILAASLRFAGLRLYLSLPALTLAAWLVSLRTLHLRLHGRWVLLHSGIIALIVGELVAALHYLPVSPVAYGLFLLGAAYCLTSLAGSLLEGAQLTKALVEPGIVLSIFWIAAFLIR